MSDTPITDAMSEGFDYRGLPCLEKAVDCSRDLERQLAEAREKIDYAKQHGLHIGRMVTADRPEGFLAHEYIEGSTLSRIFDEWSASIGLDSQLAEAREQRDRLAEAGERLVNKWRTLAAELDGRLHHLPEGVAMDCAEDLEQVLAAVNSNQSRQ